ncbi:MAG: UDP-N-acetylmuramoyl-L-alanine--D-glutamate ligase [Myxococcota bacterium]|nr:UDP-N-acetylmuramoyl-L-alanine--D-glutamate ligase [Myxococcota bacterium]
MSLPPELAGLAGLQGKAVAVLGAARSGIAAANLLARAGAQVLLSDRKPEAQLGEGLARLHPAVRLVTGRNDLTGAELVVVSPGIPPAAPLWQEIGASGLPVWGEIELGYRAARAPLVAITGTDGKTTTTSLVGAVVEGAGRPSLVLGNIGRPLCDGVETVPPEGVLVVEVSCFQLLHTLAFRPRVAVLLNLAEDHLDYHGSFAAYVDAKLRVFARQGRGDTAVLSLDDPTIRAQVGRLPPAVSQVGFSSRGPAPGGVGLEEGWLVARQGGTEQPLFPRAASPLLGAHNTENLVAAAAAGLALGIAPATVGRALTSFASLPHRLEPAGTLDGVAWINDSKATSPHAALAGLQAMTRPVVLLAGGIDKGLGLEEWADAIVRKCHSVVLTGPLAPRLAQALSARTGAPTAVQVRHATTFAEAVGACQAAARPGDVVLLSPGCSSFDMFSCYEERGETFKRLVQELGARLDGGDPVPR